MASSLERCFQVPRLFAGVQSARSPLAQANKFNIGASRKASPRKSTPPDLDDLARQMNIETPARKSTFFAPRFETPSATVSYSRLPHPRVRRP
ncbi:hypothetical protein JCM33374_g6474 [Metschnikowia sp. JCM 33374]|nr:hypothetical protein JCM33374_g6474 [Metschnikowia sp. JCM 33374]